MMQWPGDFWNPAVEGTFKPKRRGEGRWGGLLGCDNSAYICISLSFTSGALYGLRALYALKCSEALVISPPASSATSCPAAPAQPNARAPFSAWPGISQRPNPVLWLARDHLSLGSCRLTGPQCTSQLRPCRRISRLEIRWERSVRAARARTKPVKTTYIRGLFALSPYTRAPSIVISIVRLLPTLFISKTCVPAPWYAS